MFLKALHFSLLKKYDFYDKQKIQNLVLKLNNLPN